MNLSWNILIHKITLRIQLLVDIKNTYCQLHQSRTSLKLMVETAWSSLFFNIWPARIHSSLSGWNSRISSNPSTPSNVFPPGYKHQYRSQWSHYNNISILPVRQRILPTVANIIFCMSWGRRPAAMRQEPDPGTRSSVESRNSLYSLLPPVTSSTCHDHIIIP